MANVSPCTKIYSETSLESKQTKQDSSSGSTALPHDTVRRRTYRYALVVVDIASRYKDTEPLTSKESKEVAKAFENIYSRKLNWAEVLMVDPGKAFFGDVTSLMNKHKVKFQ